MIDHSLATMTSSTAWPMRNRTPERQTATATTGSEPVGMLLARWRDGDPAASEALLPLVYGELRRIAAGFFRRGGSTLQPTVLVHDAYLRLCRQAGHDWVDRDHFYGVAARCMRQVLVEHLRKRNREKRGGHLQRVTLVERLDGATGPGTDAMALHQALERLEAFAPEQARIVELRYFGGLSIDETAQTLGLSAATVVRRWRRARAWLYRTLHPARRDERER